MLQHGHLVKSELVSRQSTAGVCWFARGHQVRSIRATGGEVIPGVRVAYAFHHLPDRFAHQLGLILVDVVTALGGDREARVRDEGGQIFVSRAGTLPSLQR